MGHMCETTLLSAHFGPSVSLLPPVLSLEQTITQQAQHPGVYMNFILFFIHYHSCPFCFPNIFLTVIQEGSQLPFPFILLSLLLC